MLLIVYLCRIKSKRIGDNDQRVLFKKGSSHVLFVIRINWIQIKCLLMHSNFLFSHWRFLLLGPRGLWRATKRSLNLVFVLFFKILFVYF